MSDATRTVAVAAEPPMRFRQIRVVVTVFFAAMAAVLCVLWLVSYWWVCWLNVSVNQSRNRVVILVATGKFGVEITSHTAINRTPVVAGSRKVNSADYQSSKPLFLIAIHPTYFVTTPIWFCVASCGATAGLAGRNTNFRWRFSLYSLLVVTTLVAIVLGISLGIAG